MGVCRQFIVVPAFFDLTQGAGWSGIEHVGGIARIVVPEFSFSQIIDAQLLQKAQGQFTRCRNSGQLVLGYVSTKNGARAENLIKADVDSWFHRYGQQLDGVFFDEGPEHTNSKQAFYMDLANYVRTQYAAHDTILLNAAQFQLA